MSTHYTSPPESSRTNRWQDWSNLVLAIWLFISPWVLAFGSAAPAVAPGSTVPGAGPVMATSNAAWNAWVLGVIIFLVALSALGRMEVWQEWITAVLGIWIFIAPWVLGFTGLVAASWDHWVVGALVFLISLWTLGTARRTLATNQAYAGDKPTRQP